MGTSHVFQLVEHIDRHYVKEGGLRENTIVLYGTYTIFVNISHSMKSVYHYYPSGLTGGMDLPDAGIISLMKHWLGMYLGQLLWYEEDMDLWEGRMNES